MNKVPSQLHVRTNTLQAAISKQNNHGATQRSHRASTKTSVAIATTALRGVEGRPRWWWRARNAPPTKIRRRLDLDDRVPFVAEHPGAQPAKLAGAIRRLPLIQRVHPVRLHQLDARLLVALLHHEPD